MHVKAKKMAFSGVMLALCVILIVLSGVLEINTLFLLALASFLVGIETSEFGLKMGFAYLAAAVILGFFIAPNKMYCITFAAMGLYVLCDEALWICLQQMLVRGRISLKKLTKALWIGKWIIFNIIYLPILFGAPKLLFSGEMSAKFVWFALLGGQAAWWIYDRAYEYFQKYIWNKWRKILN